ncbi:hypothetical protein HOP52_18440, partial [Halomonas campisalis]|nr:hypothetical protein [Halomonas campisalis]
MSTPHADHESANSPHPQPPALPTNRLSHALDTAIAAIGKTLSWLWIATLAVVLTNVFSR